MCFAKVCHAPKRFARIIPCEETEEVSLMSFWIRRCASASTAFAVDGGHFDAVGLTG